jgi:hypothetical protein
VTELRREVRALRREGEDEAARKAAPRAAGAAVKKRTAKRR